MQDWCLEKLTSGELWKSSRCPHHAPGGTGKPAALQALGPAATSHLPWMPWRSALFRRAEPMAKATNWGHTPHFQGQSPSVGSYHKKECSWLIRGFWIKSNTFKVQTQTLGPREQPVRCQGQREVASSLSTGWDCHRDTADSRSAPFHNLWNKGIYFKTQQHFHILRYNQPLEDFFPVST